MIAEIGAPQVAALCATAFSVGVIHTILGPDHYIPFIAMARAGGWSTPRTLGVTAACGLGHVHEATAKASLSDSAGRGPATGASVWVPWALFLVFVFGPCEPLIPLLMYPAAKASPWAVALVVAAFTIATVGTMLAAVLVVRSGASLVKLPRLDRFSHAFAGLAVLVCGMLVKFGL
jgi:nickel/cobalt exporter